MLSQSEAAKLKKKIAQIDEAEEKGREGEGEEEGVGGADDEEEARLLQEVRQEGSLTTCRLLLLYICVAHLSTPPSYSFPIPYTSNIPSHVTRLPHACPIQYASHTPPHPVRLPHASPFEISYVIHLRDAKVLSCYCF